MRLSRIVTTDKLHRHHLAACQLPPYAPELNPSNRSGRTRRSLANPWPRKLAQLTALVKTQLFPRSGLAGRMEFS